MALPNVIILIILSSAGLCLHTTYSTTKGYSQEYLESLIERQSKLRADLNNLKANSELLRSKLSMRDSQDPDTRVRLFQESLAEERDTLRRIETYLGLPFSIGACQCLNISDSLKSESKVILKSMEDALSRFNDSVSKCVQCPAIHQIKMQAQKQNQYAKDVRDILQSDCCEIKSRQQPKREIPIGVVNLNTSIYVSNLDNTKWIFGNTTQKQIKYSMFALSSKHNIIKCKPQTPIAISPNQCANCPKNTPIWNVGESRCVSCPQGFVYNQNSHSCQNKPSQPLIRRFNSNPKAQNYIGRPPERQANLPDCPIKYPFSIINKCIGCNSPMVFNFNSLKCQTCEDGEKFDINLHDCRKPQQGFVSDLYAQKNWITIRPHIEIYNTLATNISLNKDVKCPSNTPYYDSITCVACKPPKVFDIDSELCKYVPADKMFDENMHELLPKDSRAYNTRPNSKNLLIPKPQLKPAAPNDQCPLDRPYYDGVACVYCQEPFPLFNLESLKCERCHSDHVYNPLVHRCEKSVTQRYTDLSAPDILVPDNASIEDYRAKQAKQINASIFPSQKCPQNKPFYNGTQCIICSSDSPLFQVEKKQCTKCDVGLTYSQQINKCLKDFYYSNLESGNILTTPNYGVRQYNNEIEQKKRNYPGMKIIKCSDPAKPFVINGQCNSCPSNAPLYDLATKKCTQCAFDRDYDPLTKSCKFYNRITSPKSPNLFLQGGRIEEYQSEYNQAKIKNPELRDCPLSAPYYDGRTCIHCSADKPLFDLIVKKCIKCLGDTRFNEKLNSCVATGQVEASLERLIMNT